MKRVTKALKGLSKAWLPGLLTEVMFKDEFKNNILFSLISLIAVY